MPNQKRDTALTVGRILLLSLPYAWISIFNSVLDNGLPVILTAPIEDGGLALSYTLKGVVMALDNILGLFLLPIFGRLSDQSKNKWGKRTPFILVGGIAATGLWAATGLVLGTHIVWLFITILTSALAFLAISRPASLAILPDFTPLPQRRFANSLTQVVSIICTAVGIGIIALLTKPGYPYIFYGASAIMLVFVVLYVLFVHERQWTTDAVRAVQALPEEAAEKKAPKNKKPLILLLLAVFFFYIAYNGLVSSLSNYAVDFLHLDKNKFIVPQAATLAMAMFAAVPVAKISAKVKRKLSLVVGIAVMIGAFILAGVQPTLNARMFASFLLVGAGFSAVIVNLYPYVLELSDDEKIGEGTGIFNMVMTVAMVLTPVFSGWLADLWGIATLFPYCIIALVIALGFLLLVKEPKDTMQA
ncbi:MAG: MFS transporter [Oscillospiraceae bacterium]|jgi:MFS family permease|nr:MFS transporter [Oscillospiraceae bacterium]